MRRAHWLVVLALAPACAWPADILELRNFHLIDGTRNGALALGEGDRRGTVEVGRVADLPVLEASPLEDLANTARIRSAIKHGRLLPSEE